MKTEMMGNFSYFENIINQKIGRRNSFKATKWQAFIFNGKLNFYR